MAKMFIMSRAKFHLIRPKSSNDYKSSSADDSSCRHFLTLNGLT